jgi:serpin B
MKNKFILLLTIFAFVFCSRAAAQDDSEGPEKASKAINAFAMDLYNQVKANAGNIVFSPYGISDCMAFAYAGAKTTTAEEIAGTMCYPDREIQGSFKSLDEAVKSLGSIGGIELNIADSLWAEQSFEFYPGYLDSIKTNYYDILEKVDFKNDWENVRLRINGWVGTKTREMIKDMLPEHSLDTKAQLVLLSALYFKGEWASPFKGKSPKNVPFWPTGVTSVDAPMMKGTKQCYYQATEEAQVLTLLYHGNHLSLTIILPKQKDGLAALENSLDAAKLSFLTRTAGRYVEAVVVYLPKFKITKTWGLAGILQNMGMKEAFSPCGADFTGMANTARTCDNNLSITGIFHKVSLEVDEGRRAAAGRKKTLDEVETDSEGSSTVFCVDHPFIFVIKDNIANVILFMGKVVNPKE